MVKVICDKCKKEFSQEVKWLEGVIREKKPIMLTPEKGKQIVAEQIGEQKIHLCSTCVMEMERAFLSKSS